MSRTDAHAPYWTQAVWYEPSHHLYCELYTNRLGRHHLSDEPCNLPERAVRHAGVRNRRYVPLCTWEPVWPTWRQVRWLNVGRVPHWYTHHVWFEPDRVRTRDTLRDMAKEYNALGVLEDGDFPNYQHRHGATWYWD